MPRPLIYSNGSFLLGLDKNGAVRDLFYPHVGLYNHLNGHRIRMGLWANGHFSWTDEPPWRCEQSYKPGGLVGQTILTHNEHKIRLEIAEAVSHRENWFARRIRIQNRGDTSREFRLFFTHDLRIMESDVGDTALYHPEMGGIVHYKGPCYFLFAGEAEGRGVYQYATGIKGFAGLEGTWRDAEDGELSNNPIAQGSVDSTFSLQLHANPGEEKEAWYWAVAAEDLERLYGSQEALRRFGISNVLEDTHSHWREWCDGCSRQAAALPPEIAEMARRSLLMVRTHIDNMGAIIAATDSDIMETNRANYCFMWPRDGALISSVLDEAGQHHLPRAFFEFCNRILPKHPPVLRQKYTAQGWLGATWHPFVLQGKPHTPFQEDETALMILAMWRHHEASPSEEALTHHYKHFIEPAADYICEFRDKNTGLPLPSYDLWEERLGIHAFTVSTVIAGLDAASKAARVARPVRASVYAECSASMRDAFLRHFLEKESGTFVRRLSLEDGSLRPDLIVDSSCLHIGLLGILNSDDPRVSATADLIERRLWLPRLGGLARYEGDYYFRRHEHLPGNPWIICTLWLAQHHILAAKSAKDLDRPMEMLRWCFARALPTGVLPEQVDAVTGEPLSVAPLTWSHAEFVKTAFEYVKRMEGLAAK